MKRLFCLLLSFVLLLKLVGCTAAPQHEDGRLHIVTTLFPYYDFARAVVGDRAEVTLLLSPGREAHSFEPTPLDAVTISHADVFIYNGGEGETWVDDMLGSVGENIRSVLCMFSHAALCEEEFVEGMQSGGEHDHDDRDDHDDHDGEEVGYDEHIWTSVANAERLCRAVCDTLCEADSANADYYRKNCESYCAQLSALDAEFTALRQEAVRNTLVFADRFPMLYFCKEYDLNYRAAFHGCSSDTEPSLATMKYLIDLVNAESIPVIYTIDLSSQRIAEAVSEATGAEIRRIRSLQTVSREDFDAGETYISLMERNLNALREGLVG